MPNPDPDPEIRFLGDLQRLQPQRGDVFVLSVPGRVDRATAERIRQLWSETMGQEIELLVLDGDSKLGVIGPSVAHDGTTLADCVAKFQPTQPLATKVNVGQAVLEALGLGQDRDVKEVVIRLGPNNVAEVDVTRHVRLDAMKQALQELTPYKLVRRDIEEQPASSPEPACRIGLSLEVKTACQDPHTATELARKAAEGIQRVMARKDKHR